MRRSFNIILIWKMVRIQYALIVGSSGFKAFICSFSMQKKELLLLSHYFYLIVIPLNEQTRGHSYRKFNSSLTEEETYISTVNRKIPEWLEKFKDVTDKRVLLGSN